MLSREVRETLVIQSFTATPVRLLLELDFGADFADMLVIRGYHPGRRGSLLHPIWTAQGDLCLRYEGADQRTRTTVLSFDPEPDHRHDGQARYLVCLDPGGRAEIRLSASLRDRGEGALDRAPVMVRGHSTLSATRVTTDNQLFDRVLERSFDDLRMLLTHQRGASFFAAGTPWFVALFGRVSLIAAL